jgi:hypothetical protein
VRILAAVIIWIVFLGGLILFLSFRDSTVTPSSSPVALKQVEASYALLVTTAFALEPDPFAVRTDDKDRPPALLVRMGNYEILRETDRLAAGTSLRVEPVSGLVLGDNELYLQASPPIEEADKNHAIRLQILFNNRVIAEKIFWSPPGGKPAGTFRFTLTALQDNQENHEHH